MRLILAIDKFNTAIGKLAGWTILILTLAISYEVFARYAMNAPTVWAYEIGYVLTGSHFLLAMAYALQKRAHIRIDIFSGKFSLRTRAIIDLLAYAVVLPLMVWLSTSLFSHLATGYLRHERSGQSAMNLPVWPFRVVFFVAFTLLALQLFVEEIKSARVLRSRG